MFGFVYGHLFNEPFLIRKCMALFMVTFSMNPSLLGNRTLEMVEVCSEHLGLPPHDK